MKFTDNEIDIAQCIWNRFVEGKERDFLMGYLLGITEYDELEHEKYLALEEFIYALFNYKPQN